MHETLMLLLQKVQGKVFELSLEKGFASEQFIDLFMRSKCAADLDMTFNRLQWLGEEYIMEELIDELGGKLVHGKQYSEDAMFWIGYTYRFWHFHTGESSRNISHQASADKMVRAYPGYHTFANMELAVEKLKEDAEARDRRAEEKRRRRKDYESGETVLSPAAAKTVRKT